MDDKWLRLKEREKLWKIYFKRKKSVSQLGPRRLGKTFLMHLIEKDAAKEGFNTVFINLEGMITIEGVIQAIADAVINNEGLRGYLDAFKAGLISIIKGKTDISQEVSDGLQKQDPSAALKVLLKKNWGAVLEQLLATINQADKPTILLVDELSVCLLAILERDASKGGEFLYTLRNLRQKYPSVIWMITGSIGINHIAEQYNIEGALNDLNAFELKPLKPEEAKALLYNLCKERCIELASDADAEHFIESLGWLSPHYLIKLLDSAEEILIDRGSSQLDANIINMACENLLSYPANRIFNNWLEHINKNYPQAKRTLAIKLLNELSENPKGSSINTLITSANLKDTPEEAITNVLKLLIQDGYLLKTDNNYHFMFSLLRQYWQKQKIA